DDDSPSVERALDDVADPLRQRTDRDVPRLVDLARLVLLDVGRWQLDLDEMRAQLRGDVGRITADIYGRLALFAQPRTARIRPDHDDQPVPLRFLGSGPQLLVHLKTVFGAGV